ncbi:hypothetical protein ElyMa_003745200 [Elysia marginata]|uniref:DUF3504 domain-containing protein n=1 Tax=Elysia marginata TaxID=1093978 RepID=A0AAV4F6M8_9GAST|nr:hypothetical protein ElyMa_003745200 [Elysia marginata]
MPPPLKPQISTQQEELLWERRILSLQSSSGLIQAVIFYLIKSCGVFQGKDLRQLKTEHVKFGEDSVGNFVTIDFSSVVCSGKIVRHYEDPNNPRSLYKLLKTYIRYLANEGAFLVRPISSIKDYICYSPWPLGVSIIEHMVQTLMEEAGQGNRYGNISASLLALDVLKSYGAGRHCLATWVDSLGGAALCYRAKILNSKVPDCSTINCRDLNAEAGLVMSHLLDPPYPSSTSATQADIKTYVEESEESRTDGLTNGTPPPREHTRGGSLNSNRDRLRAAKRCAPGLSQVRRVTGGAGRNLLKRQARLMRLKPTDSQKLPSSKDTVPARTAIDLTQSESDSPVQTKEVKTEPQFDEEMPEVEIDLAADLQLGLENSGQGYIANGDMEEPSEACAVKEKRNRETSEEKETSPRAGKIPKIEQHFQELEASLCGNLEAFGDGADQREDITIDKSGETTEDFLRINGTRTSLHFPSSKGSPVTPKVDAPDIKESKVGERSQSPKKSEHLSLVAGLENWLERLKQRVNSGSDPDMNGLLLQATSQLKVIADRVIAIKDATKSDLSPDTDRSVAKKAAAESDMNSSDPCSEDQPIKHSDTETVHQPTSVVSHPEEMPPSNAARQEIPPSNAARQEMSSDTSRDPPLSEDPPTPGCVTCPGSPVSTGPASVDLSPPVLSPQPPTHVESDRGSFLFNHLSLERNKVSQTCHSENQDQSNLTETLYDHDKNDHIPTLDGHDKIDHISVLKDHDKSDHTSALVSQDKSDHILTLDGRDKSEHTAKLDGHDKSDHTSTSKSSPVPDLVKFLESANLQMQSLLSRPQGGVSSPQPNDSSVSEPVPCTSTSFSSFSTSLAQAHKLPQQSAITDSSASLTNLSISPPGQSDIFNNQQSRSTSGVQNQNCSSWPVLRSVLEEALPPRTSATSENLLSATSGKLYPSSGNITSTTCTLAKSIPSTILSQVPRTSLAAQSGMYTFQSDHTAGAAFQSLTVVSGDKRSQVFTFPDLPLDEGAASSDNNLRNRTPNCTSATQAVQNARSELCLGDYLPRGARVPASSIKVLTQQGSNGLEVVLRFDFSRPHPTNV